MAPKKYKQTLVISDAQVLGLTCNGAILLRDQEDGYRIEVGIEGAERLAYLCAMTLKNHSTNRSQLEQLRKS